MFGLGERTAGNSSMTAIDLVGHHQRTSLAAQLEDGVPYVVMFAGQGGEHRERLAELRGAYGSQIDTDGLWAGALDRLGQSDSRLRAFTAEPQARSNARLFVPSAGAWPFTGRGRRHSGELTGIHTPRVLPQDALGGGLYSTSTFNHSIGTEPGCLREPLQRSGAGIHFR